MPRTTSQDKFRNAFDYAIGNRYLEKIITQLSITPAYPAELKRISKLNSRSWNILWNQLKDSGLLNKKKNHRKWKLLSDKELLESWSSLCLNPTEIQVSPRAYARCRSVPKSFSIRFWEMYKQPNQYWQTRLECPYCGHFFPAPKSSVWKTGVQLKRNCGHLIFVCHESKGWLHKSTRFANHLNTKEPYIINNIQDIAALNSVGGQASRVAWRGSICISFIPPSRSFGSWLKNITSNAITFGFAAE